VSAALEEERKAAGKFVDQMLPADPRRGLHQGAARLREKTKAFLLHFDREVELLQDFTNSRDKLHHELDEMGPRPRGRRTTAKGRRPTETTGNARAPGGVVRNSMTPFIWLRTS